MKQVLHPNSEAVSHLSENPTQSSLQQDASMHLWHLILLNEGTTFKTAGRGSRPGIEFTHEFSRSSRAAGRHYSGQSIEDYGNELWIITLPDGERKKKSISRSTVDLAYRNAVEEQEREGFVSGPRKLGVPGVRSNLYAMFLPFGVISSDHGEAADVSESDATADENESVAADAE